MIGPFLQYRNLLKDFKPTQQIQILVWGGLFSILLMFIPISAWVEPDPPIESTWVRVKGYVNGPPEIWEEDKTMVTVPLQYRDPETVFTRATVYADRAHYDKASLRLRSPVFLDVEKAGEKYLVRRLVTLDGEILYSPSLREYVVERYQSGHKRMLIFMVLMSLSQFIAALIIYRRIRREARARKAT